MICITYNADQRYSFFDPATDSLTPISDGIGIFALGLGRDHHYTIRIDSTPRRRPDHVEATDAEVRNAIREAER